MKILVLTPYLPSPPLSGAPRRTHSLISGLARSHSVSVLSLVEPDEDHTASISATREYADEVVTVENDRSGLSDAGKRRLQLRSMVSSHSYRWLVHQRPALQAALDRMVQHTHYDIINVEFSYMAYLRFPSSATLVLDAHNVEYDILYRTFKAEAGLLRKLYNGVDYLKLRREERAVWQACDGVYLTSDRDEEMLRQDCPDVRTTVVPNGVDTEFFHAQDTTSEPMTIVFFGAMNYYPNIQGLLFFLQEVMPQLKQRYRSVKLVIVGQSPPESIARWASQDVIITGVVDDVRPYLDSASLVIAPLHIGGGTRLKILEAMAMGKAVVSTTVGAEGIDVTNEQDILIADTAEEFAGQVVRVLHDPALARRLGSAGRDLVERKYDWRICVRKLENFYQELLTLDGSDSRVATKSLHPLHRG